MVPTGCLCAVKIGGPEKITVRRKRVTANTEVLVFHMSDKKSFADTTRERRPFEEDGKEYHFLTREEMEEEIIKQR